MPLNTKLNTAPLIIVQLHQLRSFSLRNDVAPSLLSLLHSLFLLTCHNNSSGAGTLIGT